MPDPSGPPEPIDRIFSAEALDGFTRGLRRLVVTGGTLLTFLGLVAWISTPTLGSTRSARLKWREQKRQAEAAVPTAPAPGERR